MVRVLYGNQLVDRGAKMQASRRVLGARPRQLLKLTRQPRKFFLKVAPRCFVMTRLMDGYPVGTANGYVRACMYVIRLHAHSVRMQGGEPESNLML